MQKAELLLAPVQQDVVSVNGWNVFDWQAAEERAERYPNLDTPHRLKQLTVELTHKQLTTEFNMMLC